MPTDSDLVNAAYADVMGTIFSQIFENMAEAAGGAGDTSDAQQKFSAALHVARQSRDLALKIATS